MKILELCNFSSGIDGVFARVKEESIRLSKLGHKVRIFSSNIEKGTNKIVQEKDKIEDVEIVRFPSKKLGGESFMSWDFEKEALKFSPDIIIAHSYRHTHTIKALKIARKLKSNGKKCKAFLVTHAPFAREKSRTFIQKIIVWIYDKFYSKNYLKNFDKIISITHWENPFLEKLGIPKEKIVYIPNGIPPEFFDLKKQGQEENKILFLGRIAPIKSIETIIQAIPLLNDKSIILEIVGPAEQDYQDKINTLVKQLNLDNRVIFSPAIYDTIKKINKIDSAKIFVLPSISEGMPQSLIEALAREKIVIASDNLGNADIIKPGSNGFLFKTQDYRDLVDKINLALAYKEINRIKIRARESVESFNWNNIIKKISVLIRSKN